jgi:hypothetical protein
MRLESNKTSEAAFAGHARPQARFAAALYFLAVAIAVFCEFFAPGKLGIAAVVLPVVCSMAATLLLYSVFRRVNPRLALTAAVFNLAGLALEALQLQPGFNLAMVLHGVYAILLGALMASSRLLPRVLGALMLVAGLVWLIDLAPALARDIAPFNTVVGLVSEAIPMFWLLVAGIDISRSSAQAHRLEAHS